MFIGISPILASLAVRTDIEVFITGPGFNSISPHKNNEYLQDVSCLCIIHLVASNSFDLFDLSLGLLVLLCAVACLQHLEVMLFFSTISSLTILGPCIDLALKEAFPERYTEQIMPRR